MKQCMDAPNLHRRMKKIMGQLNAIDKMIDEDVPCEDVLIQINDRQKCPAQGRAGGSGGPFKSLCKRRH